MRYSGRSRQPVSSSPMAISLASALPRPLPCAPQKPPQRPTRPRKQSAAKLRMHPRKNDRISLATIHRAESVDGKTAMTFANASAIRRALENAGVELIEENGGGLGVRLKQPLSDQSARRKFSKS
jgi:hypothetical protein